MNDPPLVGPGRLQQHHQHQHRDRGRSPGGPRNLQESRRPHSYAAVEHHQHTAGWNQQHTTTGGAGGATVASQMRRAKALMDVQQRATSRGGTHGQGHGRGSNSRGRMTSDDLPFRRPGQAQGLGSGARMNGTRTTRASSAGGGGGGDGVGRTRPSPSSRPSIQGWIQQAKAIAALEKRRSVRKTIR